MKSQYTIALVVIGIILIAGGWYAIATEEQNEPAEDAVVAESMDEDDHAMDAAMDEHEEYEKNEDHDHTTHSHDELYEVPEETDAPTVSINVEEDAIGGYNVQLVTENFIFTPEMVNQENVMGEGHAHIYVDGEKLARVYGEWYHISSLPAGEHEIRATLNANSHSIYAKDGVEIADSVTVTVSDTQ